MWYNSLMHNVITLTQVFGNTPAPGEAMVNHKGVMVTAKVAKSLQWMENPNHPIALAILKNLAAKVAANPDIQIRISRKGRYAGRFIDLKPATVSPFFTLQFMRDHETWITCEMLIKSVVENLHIEKLSDSAYLIHIP